MPLFQRRIEVEFSGVNLTAGQPIPGPFQSPSTLGLPLTLSSLRTSVHIVAVGGTQLSRADIRIWGMTLNDMNNLSTLGMIQGSYSGIKVRVTAIDDRGSHVVFFGNVDSAVSDFQGGPNLPFHILAHSGSDGALFNVPAFTTQQPTTVSQALAQVAGQMQLSPEITGDAPVSAGSYHGRGPKAQFDDIANQTNFQHVYDPLGVAAAWPAGASRAGKSVTISPTGTNAGLVGYPSYSSLGIKLKMLFNPDVVYGGIVNVEGSAITKANGPWVVYLLVHDIESFKPNGQWFTVVEATSLGNQAVSNFLGG